MAVNPNWPLTVSQFSTAVPFDSNILPTWVDISSRVRDFRSSFGRQYELDVMEAGEATLTVDDNDEAFNPTNPSSPYYPNVEPYRQIVDQAMWPPQPVGGAVNLLNANVVPLSYDPTFESYAVAVTPWWVTAIGGTTPKVDTVAPFAGINDLVVNFAAGPTIRGAAIAVPCIPGQQYTTSAYVRLSAANTVGIFADAVAGTTTTTVASYVRISVTFTATRVIHAIQVQTIGTSGAGNFRVDNVQHEVGAAVSAFSTTGPVIYGVFAGYVERWPSRWLHNGTFGQAQITCVDALATLAVTNMHTEYRAAVLAKSPDYYWPLSDTGTVTAFAEASGKAGPPLVRYDGSGGAAATFTPGTSVTIAGDPNATGLLINGSGNGNAPAPNNTVVQTGMRGIYTLPSGTVTPQISMGSAAFPAGVSVAFWVQFDPLPPSLATGQFLRLSGGLNRVDIKWQNNVSGEQITSLWSSSGGSSCVPGGVTTTDKKLHLVVVTFQADSSNVVGTCYVDGAVGATITSSTAGWVGPYTFSQIQVGALMDNTSGATADGGPPNGVYAHVAVWGRALSASEASDLWQAGQGYVGEMSGTRISRYLNLGNYIGPTAIDVGQSVMGVGALTEGETLLDACQKVSLSENGTFYAEAGTVTFKSRADRYLKTASKWTFGERADLGEYPYRPDIAFDYDPTRIMNDVQVTRAGGATATATDTASQKAYFRRSYSRTVNIKSDLEATDAANYLLQKNKKPAQRVSRVTIEPSSNPTLWPVALGARIGDRVTVKRRTSAGYTMSADYYIERIEHNRGPDVWTTSFQMSPVTNTQPWILGDSTYGVLDTTTIPAY